MIYQAFGRRQTLPEWAAEFRMPTERLQRLVERGVHIEWVSRMPRYARIRLDSHAGGPKSWTWWALTWEQDPWAQEFVRKHPEGADLDKVGKALGVTKEAVRQLEERALRKVRACARELGYAGDVVELLREAASERDRRCA